MDAIDVMIQEYNNIKSMLEVARKLCIKVINYEKVEYKVIDFVRNYVDKHHHSKEEVIYFEKLAAGEIFESFR